MALPGPRPMPNALKILRGNPYHESNVQLNDGGPPQPDRFDSVPEPPDFLEEYAKAEWLRVAPQLCKLGLLTALDLVPFMAYCWSVGNWRTLIETDGDCPAARSAAQTATKFSLEFGMTPAARCRIKLADPPKENKFGNLAS
jgi:phage terminase small subunit